MQRNEGKAKITAEDVISKLKDDGDFDTLRLKIIRKLKENDGLRNSIISAVKQSAALNRPGAENLKPRQLSDAIHEEIGSKVMGQISDGLWEVIKSSNGMKNEITETVQSVYDKLVKPKEKEVGENASAPNDKGGNGSLSLTCNGSTCDEEPAVPPGFPLCDNLQANSSQSEHKDSPSFSTCDRQQSNDGQVEHKESPAKKQRLEVVEELPSEVSGVIDGGPPGFSTIFVDNKRGDDGSDEDPDLPPGFG
ncbi:Adenosine monophosphate-protein transferase and cysteine protease ibpA [Cinnamomum micranthum f. kanehirae]|uniref:Adenosine monophosphate-protein transferase and cysteine protease ibpA n=1 Tax=Cinnamomum micranthum f. kanehirae TaxID=337451 RepID=A0A443NPT4_9MAGN|nr:Adenosine monophosphate-protein transferase and cysteine protease ibpA [Cinnamomum micranthum f. kanehirae]